MTSSYFRIVFRAFGNTPERCLQILSGTGLDPDDMRSCPEEISVFQQVQQFRNMSRIHGSGWATGVRDLWGPASHGFLGVASMAGGSIGTMMRVVSRFGPVRAPYHRLIWRRGPVWSRLEFELIAPVEASHWQTMTEITFMGLKAAMVQMLGHLPETIRYNFSGGQPQHADELAAALEGSITYNAASDALIIPTALLDVPSPFSDSNLFRVATAELRAYSRRLQQPENMRGRVEQILRSLPAERLNEGAVAQAAGVSRRTLVRRLSESGASYRQLADDELRRRATKLLKDGIDRAQAAEELGYMDPTSFSRACRRWFGQKRPAAAQTMSA